MKKSSLFALLLSQIVIVWVMLALRGTSGPVLVDNPAYRHVLQTQTLRCAYMLWPPVIEKDPVTGKMSGYGYDTMEAMAKSLGIKISWGPEIALGAQVEALTSGKADAVCVDAPLQLGASLQLAYATPFAYFPIFAYVRVDDKRFTNKNEQINRPEIKASMIDGDISHALLDTLYTKTQRVQLPQLADPAQMMMDVVSKKSDVVLTDAMTMVPFFENNPNKLRKLSKEPLMVLPGSVSVLRTETALLDMLSQGVHNMRDRGIEKQINEKYGITMRSPDYFPVQQPFVVP